MIWRAKKPRTNENQGTIEQHVFSVRHRGGNGCQQVIQRSQGTIQSKKPNYEPDIRAVKAITCAFTVPSNLLEVWLSKSLCTNPLVHQGQQLAVQRCLCCASLCLSLTCLEVVPQQTEGRSVCCVLG